MFLLTIDYYSRIKLEASKGKCFEAIVTVEVKLKAYYALIYSKFTHGFISWGKEIKLPWRR